MSVYADEDIFVTETNIPMLVTIVTMRAPIISETWSPEDTCHLEGRGVTSCYLFVFQLVCLFFYHDLDSDDEMVP